MSKNIDKIYIHEFRKFNDIEIVLGNKVTAIAGKNGTMKTTLLGIIGQPFSMKNKENPMYGEKTVDGSDFSTELVDKFKFSPTKDVVGHHRWDVYFGNDKISDINVYPVNSIKRGSGTNKLRFWHATSKEKGTGFRMFPVIFLSLQRLAPLGESGAEEFDSSTLTDEEKEFINKYYDEILCSKTDFLETGIVSASNKKSTLTHVTSEYDANGISAGQDNVGKILLAILSFKRLKEKFPSDYHGGLLLIDELDAAMYPASQEKLTECLFRFASDFNIQVVFSTHSMHILKKLKDKKYSKDSEIVYLVERGGNIINHPNPTSSEMENHLNAVARKPNQSKKVKVYTEDEVGKSFAKSILGRSITKFVEFDNFNCSAEHYFVFLDKKISEFQNSLIILDGDMKNNKNGKKRFKNVVILPPNCIPQKTCPEKLFYDFLVGLPDTDKFWSTELDGHTKDTCFRDFISEPNSTDKYKKWYDQQKEFWGRGCCRLHNRWIEENKQEVERFRKEFIDAHNLLCESLEFDKI